MKSLEQTLKNNAKLLDEAVTKKLDSITNVNLSSREIDRIMQCIYCDKHLRYNGLFYDIVGKFYEMKTGTVPVRSKILKKCTHPRWALCSNLDIVIFLKHSFEYGYSDIWAMAGDTTKVPSFGPKEAISVLANFDLMEFVLKKHADSTRASQLYGFDLHYKSFIQQKNARRYGTHEDHTLYQIDCDELRDISEQMHNWMMENKCFSIHQTMRQNIIDKYGKGLATRFDASQIANLVFDYQQYSCVYPVRDLVMGLLKEAGREWILSLDPRNYDMTSLDDVEKRLEYNHSLMTHTPAPGTRWYYEKKDLAAWKREAEAALGRKIVL